MYEGDTLSCSDLKILATVLGVFVCLLQPDGCLSSVQFPGISLGQSQHVTRGKEANFPRSPQPEIVLGGLFPVHSEGRDTTTQTCGGLSVERGIHRLEAMLFAVKQINEDTSILPNITLGVSAHDTCGLDTVALEESLEFILEMQRKENSAECPTLTTPSTGKVPQTRIIAGVVGAAASTVSIQVASLLRLFQLPQISYASTTPTLSDKTKYDFFVRTVPSDTYQARAMLDVVLALNWTSVNTVNSKGAYGQAGMQEFLMRAKNASICIASKFQFDSDTDADRLVREFYHVRDTRGVVLFCTLDDIRRLLEAVKRQKIPRGHFVWIASDYWGTQQSPVEGLEDAAEGAITISLKGGKSDEFKKYFNALRPRNHSLVNPWFDQFWEKHFNCSLKPNQTTCALDGSPNVEKFDDFVPFVIDAVYAFAHALHALYARQCPVLDGLCDGMKKFDQRELLEAIHNVSFKGVAGNVTFHSNGNTKGRYDIFRYSYGRYTKVASWEGSLLQSEALVNARQNNNISASQCGAPCAAGSRQQKTGACCWTCEECPEGTFVKGGLSCVTCETGQRPNTARDGCEKLARRSLNKAWIITVLCFTSIGIACTLFVLALFIAHNDTPIVKASGRELTYALLLGLLLSYIVALLLVVEPSTLICAVQRFGLGFGFSICYSALLIKTNRIARIFKKSERSTKPPNLINPLSQIAILAVFVLIQSVLAAVSLVRWAPKAIEAYPTENDVLLICNIQQYDLVSALSYIIFLVILCTWYAIRTRKTPVNYNEARNIGFAIYTTCILWIAFLPVQFDIGKDYATITLSINMSLNATTLLLCIFGPKVYIMVFRPTRNKRSRSLSTGWREETQGKLSMSVSEPTSIHGTDNPVPVIQNGFSHMTAL